MQPCWLQGSSFINRPGAGHSSRSGVAKLKLVVYTTYLVLLTACAITADSDWQPRIGRFSLDDAKRELGRPESCVGLDDGGTACSWTIAKSRNAMDKLVLTFGPNGKLATFNNVHF